MLIDKREHNETYKVWKYDPYHYFLSVLLERYLFFLEEMQRNGDVMIESRGGHEDRRLKESFSKIYEKGTDYIHAEKYHNLLTSKQLKVQPKILNISGLQIADLIAHPSRRDILIEFNLKKKKREVFLGQNYRYIKREKILQKV